MTYPKTGEFFEGQFDKDLKEGVGYFYSPNGKIYCGQYRQDHEEGVGEYLSQKPDIKFAIDYKKMEQILDKVYKQSR
jgi:hypothetical protein